MTQLTLGLDRDSGIVSEQFDERDESVKYLLELAINACKKVKSILVSVDKDHQTILTLLSG